MTCVADMLLLFVLVTRPFPVLLLLLLTLMLLHVGVFPELCLLRS